MFNIAGEQDVTPKTYEMCWVDADTILYQAAVQLQENYITVTHKASGRKKEFKGVKEFYGLGKAKNKGWIGEQNKVREEKGQPLLSVDDFEIEQCARLIEPPNVGQSLIEYGLQLVGFKVGEIKKVMDAEDYRMCIGGGRNFRYDIAKIVPYKNTRTDKPLMLSELREAFLDTYHKRAILVESRIETDDFVSMRGWESYAHFLKTGKHKYVLAFLDKDLNQIMCPRLNYMKCEEGITVPTIMDCAKAYVTQMFTGDSIDTIPGLPNVSKEFAQKYGVTQRGVGKATAEKILQGCATPKELYERVVEAYKSYYGEEPFEFTAHDGEKSMRTWLDMLRENAALLYMCRTESDIGTYDIQKTLDKLGVAY